MSSLKELQKLLHPLIDSIPKEAMDRHNLSRAGIILDVMGYLEINGGDPELILANAIPHYLNYGTFNCTLNNDI